MLIVKVAAKVVQEGWDEGYYSCSEVQVETYREVNRKDKRSKAS